MLRCPPSRINLTNADVKALEHRLASRESTVRLPRPDSSNVRLSPGPAHPTRLSIVSLDRNPTLKRPVSALSGIECSDEGDSSASGIRGADTHTSSLARHDPWTEPSHPNSCHEGVGPDERALNSQQPVDNFVASQPIGPMGDRVLLGGPSRLDGVQEPRVRDAPGNERPLTKRGNTVLGDIQADAYPSARRQPAPSAPSTSSRSRMRYHQHASIQDFAIRGDATGMQEAMYRRHISRPVPGARVAAKWGHPVPDFMLYEDASYSTLNLGLDPGAPVFVPRTRFGSVVHPSVDGADHFEPHWGSLDNTQHMSDLRIRSSSQRNTEQWFRQRRGRDRRTTESNPDRTYHRSRSTNNLRHHSSDQNAFVPANAHIVRTERHPLLDSSSRRFPGQRTNGPLRRDSGQTDDVSRSTSAASYYFARDSGPIHPSQSTLHVNRIIQSDGDPSGSLIARTRSMSPMISVSTRSTPNLLRLPSSAPQTGSRATSRSLIASGPRLSSATRVPSMVSAASGASESGYGSRRVRPAPDATEEFLHRRNSPLDELTESFSRMRSVGRSWERTPDNHARVSLLTGDIFNQNRSYYAAGYSRNTTVVQPAQQPLEGSTTDAAEERRTAITDPALLSISAPLSSPFSTSSALPSSPPVRDGSNGDSRSALTQLSPSKQFVSPETSVPRKTTATPKVNVYNDSYSPSIQPQGAPADTATRARLINQPGASGQQSPIIVGHMILPGPPLIPERQMHRSTHASSADQLSSAVASTDPRDSNPASTSSRPHRYRRETHGQRGNEQAENDLHGNLPGLEADRRTWLSRREAGSMDVTPPKEGRFERYLS